MHWTPPSQNQINNVNNPFRHLTEQQLRNQLNQKRQHLGEGRYSGKQLYDAIVKDGVKLGVVLNTAYYLYDNQEQKDSDFDVSEGDEAGPRIWEISGRGGNLIPSPGPLAKDYKKRYNKNIIAMIDEAFRKNNIKVSSMKFYTESTELTEAWNADSVKRNADIGSDRGYGITLKPHKNPNKHKHMLMTRSTGGKIKVKFDFGKTPENVFVGTPEEVADHINKVLGLTEGFEGFEISESAKAIHKKLMQKGRVTPIDTDRYPKRKGLEGPYRSKKTGKVFYYDPKEGKYYDPNSDIYLDVDDVMEETLHEKLKVSDGLGAWIKDFMKSDAPQFKSKSDKEKRDMAIAAFTDAGGKLDEARQPFAVVDTSNDNEVVATASTEEGAKSIINKANLPPLSIKDKSKLKIVKTRKKQHIGHSLTELDEAKGILSVKPNSSEWRTAKLNTDKNIEGAKGVTKLKKGDTVDIHPFDGDRYVGAVDKSNQGTYFFLAKYSVNESVHDFDEIRENLRKNLTSQFVDEQRHEDMVDAVNKMSKDELKKLMRDKKSPMAKLAFRRFNRMQNPRKYPSDQLDENILVKRGKKFQAGVPKWFGVTMTGLPKYPTQKVAGWKTELETGSGMPGYKSYLLHNDGLGTWTVFADADNTGMNPKMSPRGPLGSFKSPEEAMKFVEKAVLKEEADETLVEGIKDIQDIVKKKSAKSLKFKQGGSMKVDMTTANALLAVYNALNSSNKKKFEDMLTRNKSTFTKAVNFTWKHVGGKKESYEIDEEMSNLSVVSESFDQVRDRVYQSVVKHGTYLGKDKNFGRHFWQYKDFLYVHGEGGKMMNNLGSVAIPSNKRMMKDLIAGDPPLTEETLDENILVKRGKKFQAGVPKWFGVVMRGLPKYPEQPVAGWKTELETGSGMPGYKSYLLHNDGLGTWTVFADADNVGNRPRMSSKGPLGSFKSPEEAMKFVEKAVLKEGKNDREVTFDLPNGGKAIDFGRWAAYVHKSAEDYDKLSGSSVRLVGITTDMKKRQELEAKLEEMGGFIKSTNSLTDEYTWDAQRGAYVRTDGDEGPEGVPVLIDKGNPVADEVPHVLKYPNTVERKARTELGESTQDEVGERELELFITNDSQTYSQRITPIIKNLARKMKKGNFDEKLAVKGFMYAVDHGIKRYKDEFGSAIKLDKAAKMRVAQELLDGYREEIEEVANN